MTSTVSKFTEGVVFNLEQPDSNLGISEVVDFRGDVTLNLKSGDKVEGYVFNKSESALELYKKEDIEASFVLLKDIESISFSGKDTAKGKSFEDWQAKKASEKAAIKAAPVEE
jgi:hypothetical protein